ncbi:hypothetical protein GQ44DRAFT_491606 [Phaeosphaeriaceae sp. PMI808]|nr:hypothetical protein GQ44DRAFT_491606 [Phaeosphaeriaceae sp. PMI808]
MPMPNAQCPCPCPCQMSTSRSHALAVCFGLFSSHKEKAGRIGSGDLLAAFHLFFLFSYSPPTLLYFAFSFPLHCRTSQRACTSLLDLLRAIRYTLLTLAHIICCLEVTFFLLHSPATDPYPNHSLHQRLASLVYLRLPN